MITRLFAGAAVAAFLVVVAITVASLRSPDSPQSGAQAGRTSQPTPTEAAIVFNPAQPTPLTRSAGARAEYDRITSVDGGWSFEIPATWTATSAAMRGADIASFEVHTAPLDGNAPAADQLRMRVQLTTDYDLTPLEKLGARDVPSWLVVRQSQVTVGGRSAVRTVKNAYVPAGSPFDKQHVVWDFRSPFLADRVVLVDAWPADGSLAVEADHAMATLELFPALPVPTVPKISRTKAMALATDYASHLGTAGGSTGKLVSFKEYDQAQIAEAKRVGGPYTIGGLIEPDQLIWIVVVRGTFEQMAVSRPHAPPGANFTYAPPPTLAWIAVIVNAIDGGVGNYIPGVSGDGPAWFGALPDRAR